MNEEALKYAQTQADTFRNTLQYLVNTQNEQQKIQNQLAATNYQNTLNKINESKYDLNATYEQNARQAYVNKLLGAQEIGAGISRMGLSDSGFRATQDVLNNNQYSANLNKLALDRAAGLRDLANQEATALNTYNSNLLNIQGDANDRLLALNKYIEEQVNDKYNTEYNNYIANQKYQDALKQQEWENNFANRQLAQSLYLSQLSNSTNNENLFGDGEQNNEFTGNGDLTGNSDLPENNKGIPELGALGVLNSSTNGDVYNRALREARSLYMTPKGGNLQAIEMLLATYVAKNQLGVSDVEKILKAIGATK